MTRLVEKLVSVTDNLRGSVFLKFDITMNKTSEFVGVSNLKLEYLVYKNNSHTADTTKTPIMNINGSDIDAAVTATTRRVV
tara:strand:+ start:403 stop:645 length:243 start_codon:yes stop_codon:yes gene_type:complete